VDVRNLTKRHRLRGNWMRAKRERADDATAGARGRIEIRPISIRLRLSKVRSRARMSRDVSMIARALMMRGSCCWVLLRAASKQDLCGLDATLLQFW